MILLRDRIVNATGLHARYMAPRLRLPDVAEVWASHGVSPLQALQYAVRESRDAWVWLRDTDPVCMYGVQAVSHVSNVGCPWMLTTNDIVKYRYTFLKHCREVVRAMLIIHPHLMGWVDARNVESKKWLAWMGFEIQQPEPFGRYRMLFHKFEMVR